MLVARKILLSIVQRLDLLVPRMQECPISRMSAQEPMRQFGNLLHCTLLAVMMRHSHVSPESPVAISLLCRCRNQPFSCALARILQGRLEQRSLRWGKGNSHQEPFSIADQEAFSCVATSQPAGKATRNSPLQSHPNSARECTLL